MFEGGVQENWIGSQKQNWHRRRESRYGEKEDDLKWNMSNWKKRDDEGWKADSVLELQKFKIT